MANTQALSILLITGNENKLREFQTLLAGKYIKITHRQIDLNEVQSANPEIVGRHKIEQAIDVLGPELKHFDAVFCDDTSLHISAMRNGLPGPFIKWFLEALGKDALVEFAERRNNMRATAVCTLSTYFPADNSIVLISGKTNGKLTYPKGTKEFGWDPIFIPDGYSLTFGELDPAIKNQISHRALAASNFKNVIKEKLKRN